MRTRLLLIGSVALNLLLIAVLWIPGPPREEVVGIATHSTTAQPGEVRTNVVFRRQFFSWAELESEDYSTYIANLRAIGCPEETVRDIIIADVNNLFSRRRSTEALPTTRQWWQDEADPAMMQAAYRQLQALETERNLLLTELLGPDWNQPLDPAPTVAIKVPLDGAVLGTLPMETQEAVQQVSGRTQQRFERLLEGSAAGEPDPAALADLERRLRASLEQLLTTSQLQEFLLRYSPTAHRLRSELAAVPLFQATPAETRALFGSVEDIDLRLQSFSGQGPAADAERDTLLNARDIAFQNALGPARYRQWLQLQDPAYQSAIAAAQAAGMTNAADLFYAIDQTGADQAAEIRSDTNLTPLQQEISLRRLEIEQLEAAGAVLGETPVTEPTAAVQTYLFQQGDTIADVSRRTGVPVAVILRANPSLQAEDIPPGTELVIPDRTPPLP